MPTYEYACQQCGHRFEEFQSITAKPIKKCPECGKTSLQRLLGTGAGIIFKGSGFYATDYRSDNYTQARKKEEGSGSASKGKEGAESPVKKSESKETAGASATAATTTATQAPVTKTESSKSKK
ncbi:MAG: zinc ribbon domain-containing protein [Phycisphaerae bacterium]|nr:zinc ribbon domain-containing protein [Phycisphaerae bacterium]